MILYLLVTSFDKKLYVLNFNKADLLHYNYQIIVHRDGNKALKSTKFINLLKWKKLRTPIQKLRGNFKKINKIIIIILTSKSLLRNNLCNN